MNQLPESVQKIITNKQKEAQRLSNVAKENLQMQSCMANFLLMVKLRRSQAQV